MPRRLQRLCESFKKRSKSEEQEARDAAEMGVCGEDAEHLPDDDATWLFSESSGRL